MFKILTLVTLVFSSFGAFAAQDQFSVYTLEMVETMLWNDGLSTNNAKQGNYPRLSEELEVAIEILDAELK